MNEFRTIKDVLVSDENNLIFSKLKKTTIEHQYWIIVISEILSKLPYQKTKGVSQSIVRVYESKSSFTLKKNNQSGPNLVIRLNSTAAVARVKILAPLILSSLKKQGFKISVIKPTLSNVG
tara:strand:+ start:102 stop:464 length:363 start_codon:yes stop_codon:yes gene_type:complete